MAFSDVTKLQLAARILIEWKTPRSSPAYGEVMRDIIRNNEAARELRVLSNEELLRLDENNAILWYLSESLERTPVSDAAVKRYGDKDLLYIERRICRELYSAGGDPDRAPAWPGGPQAARLSDAVMRAIESRRAQECLDAFIVLIGLESATITSPVQAAAARVLSAPRLRSTIVRRAQPILRRLKWIVDVVTLLSIIGLALLLPYTVERLVRTIFSWNSPYAVFILTMMIVGPLVAALFWFTVLFESYRRALVQDRLRRRNAREDQTAVAAMVKRSIEAACGSIPRLLVNLLKQRRDDGWYWGTLALQCTETAEAAIVREALHGLQLPELNDATRDALFWWLCSVKIRESRAETT
jgi:hypothetical protein